MVSLYTYEYEDYLGPDEKVVVATFDDEQKAKSYLEKAYLKQPNAGCPFRAASLLAGFKSATVQPRETPHNPEI